MIIHSHIPKRKKRKPDAKQRELQASWDALIKKYEPKKPIKKIYKSTIKSEPYIRETKQYPSLNTGYHDTSAKPIKRYTGDKMIGIGTLHKSVAVPLFTEDDAKDQANMRR